MSTPLRVLLIDDCERDAARILDHLRAGGYAPGGRRADGGGSPPAALTDEWAVALCDWPLPLFSGAAALAQLRERAPDIPILIVASGLGEQDAVIAMRAGARDYVTKQTLA